MLPSLLSLCRAVCLNVSDRTALLTYHRVVWVFNVPFLCSIGFSIGCSMFFWPSSIGCANYVLTDLILKCLHNSDRLNKNKIKYIKPMKYLLLIYKHTYTYLSKHWQKICWKQIFEQTYVVLTSSSYVRRLLRLSSNVEKQGSLHK